MRKSHLLLLDVGNTNTKVGLAGPAQDGRGLLAAYSLPTDPAATADSLGLDLTALVRHAGVEPGQVEALAVSSVAPSQDGKLRDAARRFFGCAALFAPEDLPLPLENRYARPQEVGADRLVTAFAARELVPEGDLIVIDFGTATTFDVVSGDAYLGGLIGPGVLSSARALATGTAKLPQISLEAAGPDIAVGRSTSASLNQGLVHGFAAMAEGLVARLNRTLDRPPATVIATGGFAPALARVTDCFHRVEPDLLLNGLLLAYGRKG
ncbi:MAG: type III pantothenate kinase [Thermodesulfobacteriota bacterium]